MPTWKVAHAWEPPLVPTATPAARVVPAGGPPAVPALALRAYREAATWAAGFDPGCRLPWAVLAGIGRVESNHGLHRGAVTRFSAGGTVSPRTTGSSTTTLPSTTTGSPTTTTGPCQTTTSTTGDDEPGTTTSATTTTGPGSSTSTAPAPRCRGRS